MRKFIFGLLMSLLASSVLLSCKENGGSTPEPTKTPEERAIEALTSGTSQVWTVAGGGSVSRDNLSVTSTYQSFELSLAATGTTRNYQTFNNNGLFDNNGNWSFLGTNLDKISFSGTAPAAGKEISFTQTGNDLVLRFSIVASPGARTEALAGTYVFTLKKKQ